MRRTWLRRDAAGAAWTYAGAQTTLRDLAKVCQVVIDGGRWHERQLIPTDWLKLSLSAIPQNPSYGLLWWLESDPVVYAARGYLNTDCYALPELRLVVARMQRRPRADATARYGSATAIGPRLAGLYRRIVGAEPGER